MSWNPSESNFFIIDFIHSLITLWHGDDDLRWDRFQLVFIEVKSGPTYVK